MVIKNSQLNKVLFRNYGFASVLQRILHYGENFLLIYICLILQSNVSVSATELGGSLIKKNKADKFPPAVQLRKFEFPLHLLIPNQTYQVDIKVSK